MAALEIVFRGVDQSQPAVASVRQGLSGVGEAAEAAGRQGGGFFSGMLQSAAGFLSANLVGAIGGQIKDFLGGAIEESVEAQQGQAALANALQNTSQKTGVTADMANDLASSLQMSTRFTDDQVLAASTLLARFDKIGKDIFPDATKTALDMAQALHQSPEAMSNLVGKALQSADGLGKLRAAGIMLSDDQEKLLKHLYETGNMAEYQHQVLGLLQQRYGGAAEAAGSTFTGRLEILGHKFDDVKQAVGDRLLPIIERFLGVLTSPAVMAGIDTVVNALADGLGGAVSFLADQAIPVLETAWEALGPVFQLGVQMFSETGAGAGVLGGQLQLLGGVWTVLQAVIDAVVPPIQAIVLMAFGLIGDFLHKHGDEIRTFIQVAWTQIGEIVKLAAELVQAIVVPIFTAVAGFLKAHGTEISAALDATWTIIKAVITAALAIIEGVIKTVLAVIHGDWAGAWAAIKEMHLAVWEQIKVVFSAALVYIQNILKIAWDAIKGVASAAWNWVWHNIIEAAWEGIKSIVSSAVSGVQSNLSSAWSNVKSDAQTAWNLVEGFITDPIGSAKSALDTTIGQIKGLLSGAWSTIRGEASSAWGGIADTIGSAFGGVVGNIKGVLNGIIDKVNDAIDAFNSLPGPDIGRIPHLAGGTPFFEGGAAVVGEHGPELIYLPRGSQVIPTQQTRSLLAGAAAAGRGLATAAAGGGDTYIFHIDARGSTMSKRDYETSTRRVLDRATREADARQRTA